MPTVTTGAAGSGAITTCKPFASVLLEMTTFGCFTLAALVSVTLDPPRFSCALPGYGNLVQLRQGAGGIIRQHARSQAIQGFIGAHIFRRQFAHGLLVRGNHAIVAARQRSGPGRARAQA